MWASEVSVCCSLGVAAFARFGIRRFQVIFVVWVIRV